MCYLHTFLISVTIDKRALPPTHAQRGLSSSGDIILLELRAASFVHNTSITTL